MAAQREADDGPYISPEDRARMSKAARQLAAYANFLRWSTNFRKDEIVNHPEHDQVVNLSVMQSGLFSFALQGEVLLLGVQKFEAAWMTAMPFSECSVSDRLYLSVEGISCMGRTLPPLTIGIFIDERRKRELMSRAKWLRMTRVTVEQGMVANVGEPFGQDLVVGQGSVIKRLHTVATNKLKQHDVGRFF